METIVNLVILVTCCSLAGTAMTEGPILMSSPSHMSVLVGDSVVFPCTVKQIGKSVRIWKRIPGGILFSGTVSATEDRKMSLVDGAALQIDLVTPEYAGQYVCEISGHPSLRVTHRLQVLIPPAILTEPEDGHVIVKKGDSAILRCTAYGNPEPLITWTALKGVLPGGVSTKQGSVLSFPSVDTDHAGIYHCEADNDVGNPATATFKLKVLYAPEIIVSPEWVHGDEDATVEISCTCTSEPISVLRWHKGTKDGPVFHEDDSVMLDHVSLGPSRNQLFLRIRQMRREDLGSYTCVADNSVGSAWKTVEISGLAEPVQMKSENSGDWESSFLLLWTVKSHSPIIEYLLRIREHKNGGEWTEVMIPVAESAEFQSLLHSHSYNVTGLQPNSKYEAVLQARNHYGWNRPSDTFIFNTGPLSIADDDEDDDDVTLEPSVLPLYGAELQATDTTVGNKEVVNSSTRWRTNYCFIVLSCLLTLLAMS